MTQISVQEIERDPVSFVDRVKAGESFRIVCDDVAIAEIQSVSPHAPGPRPFGLASGEFTVPDGFDEPRPDIAALFEGA